ncbi:hypothetical protein L204_101443 [Cryptococcus depauperatus]
MVDSGDASFTEHFERQYAPKAKTRQAARQEKASHLVQLSTSPSSFESKSRCSGSLGPSYSHSSVNEKEDSTSCGNKSTIDGASLADDDALKWYRRYPGRGRTYNQRSKNHPYKLQAITHRGDIYKQDTERYDDVKFWPFVGALKPWKLPDGVENWDWDEFEGTVALCGLNKLVIGRCTEEKPWVTLQEIYVTSKGPNLPEEILYTLAWTYHPFTCHPLIISAGFRGLIYVVDVISNVCTRILKGHGDDVLCVDIAPNNPHIIASSSSDRTTRIWNILGSTLPPPLPGEKSNENYPMGEADEGDVLVAVLAGEGKGGHQSLVVSCSFHPTKRAIATCGMDYKVKVWPLPPFPEPSPIPLPVSPQYRAKIIYFPLFSSSRLHFGYLDWVDWITDDVLLLRGEKVILTWQWLGYQRYFRDGEFAPLSMDPQYGDYTDSGSFMVISRYATFAEVWYRKLSLHRAFYPTTADTKRLSFNGTDMVTDPLFACAWQQDLRYQSHRPAPEIRLYNPLLDRNESAPKPIKTLRPIISETYNRSLDSDSDSELSRTVMDSEEITVQPTVPFNHFLKPWILRANKNKSQKANQCGLLVLAEECLSTYGNHPLRANEYCTWILSVVFLKECVI